MGIKIIGTGKYLPEKVITNEDISQHVDTSHEWILDRTGIEQRRIATTESSLDMAAAAAEQALQEREMNFHEIYKRCDEKKRYPEGRTDQQDH